VIVHSMNRLARNLDDLRRLVQNLTKRGIRIEFVKEHLSFTGEDSPMANLMLSIMGAFSEFERALLRERQREDIALAKKRGAYKGRKKGSSGNWILLDLRLEKMDMGPMIVKPQSTLQGVNHVLGHTLPRMGNRWL